MMTTTETERPQPAAPASRAVLSITSNRNGTYLAACTRCDWHEDSDGWDTLKRWAGAVAEHEEGHAPAAGQSAQAFTDVLPSDGEYAIIRHDLAAVMAVDVIEATGHEHRAIPAHTWSDFEGEVTLLLPPTGGPFQVWLHAAPGT